MLDLDWGLVQDHLLLLGIAYTLALPIAWDREAGGRSAGLRTFPIVAISSCGFSLIGADALAGSPESLSRVLQGILAGIGFIGGGSILKNSDGVSGTATAASIWAVGAIGIAVAWHRIEIALSISLVTFVTLRVTNQFKPEKNVE